MNLIVKFIKTFLIVLITLSLLFIPLEGCNYLKDDTESESNSQQKQPSEINYTYLNYPVRDYPIGKSNDAELYWDCSENDFGNYLGVYNSLSYNGFHPGEDWNLKGGKDGGIDLDLPIYSIGKGKVLKVSDLGSLGYLIVIEHEGSFKIPSKEMSSNNEEVFYEEEIVSKIYSVYLHLQKIQVNEGDAVFEDTILGYIMDPGGGPHLHFEIRKNNDKHSSDWSLIGDKENWQAFSGGFYNGYYKDLQKMIDIGLRDPSGVIEANYKRFNFKSEVRVDNSSDSEEYENENKLNSVRRNKMPLKIVFSTYIGLNGQEIFLLDLERASLLRLTNCIREGDFGAFATEPEISIDYSKIVFSSNLEQGTQVYIMNSNGTAREKLTNSGAWSPSISKDGQKIVYIDTDYNGYGNLYTMNTDGSGQTIMNTEEILESYSNPSFSFDNKKIVFEAYVDYNFEDTSGGITDLFIINSDGTKLKRITNNNLEEHNPAFSPDGSKIVFDAFIVDDSFNYHHSEEIYLMNSDGTEIQQLTNNNAYDHNPIILSDGKRIFFESNRGGFDGIYIMNIDGSNQTLIVSKKVGNYNPTISPDGKKISYISYIDGNPELYLMDSDGSNIKRLTENNYFDGNPVFSPIGSTLFYNSNFEGKGIYSIDINNLIIKKIYNDVFFNNIDFSIDNKKVVFEIQDGFDYSEILIMDLDGSNATMLTSNDVYDGVPIFTPDSSKIAFITNADMRPELYTMNLDGSNKISLTNNESVEYQIQFSNYGSEILLLEDNCIYLLGFSNLESKKKIFSTEDYFIRYVTFTPDNSKILFQMDSLNEKSSGIFIIDPDGLNFNNLIKDIIIDNFFIISPDSKKIFYISDKTDVPELYSINIDGTDLKKLTNFEY